jgi:hypothetical protein
MSQVFYSRGGISREILNVDVDPLLIIGHRVAALSSYKNTSCISSSEREFARARVTAAGRCRRSLTVYGIVEKVEIALSNDCSAADFSANTSLSCDVSVLDALLLFPA